MSDPFVHLHVASGHSLQYGASHPHVLVERAYEHEMDTLALTDRDGTYGAVKFALACRQAGIRPVIGVDLAYASPSPGTSYGPEAMARGPYDVPGGEGRRTPVKGGAFRGDRLPRVTVLAGGRAGWAALCRLVSATHLAGERGRPVTTPELISEHAAQAAVNGGSLVVLLGPGSTLGAAATARRDDHAREVLARWRGLLPPSSLVVEVVSHRLPAVGGQWGPGSSPHAARMAGVAREAGIGVVLSNAVRYADRLDAPVIDVLDAARQLVPLGSAGHREIGPHAFRANAEGFLKSGKEMHAVAEEVARLAGWGERGARDLLAHTRVVADRCALDPRADLGLGEIHFPEFDVVSTGSTTEGQLDHRPDADGALRARCEQSVGWRYGNQPRQRIWKRLDDELELIRDLGYASYFLTVAEVTDLIRDMGVRCAARGSGAGSLVNYLLGISGVDPIRHDLLMERFLSPLRRALPDIDVDVESARRLEVYERILDRFGGERCVCVSMMDTYRVRHAVRDVGAALGLPPGEIDAIAKAFPHIRARDARTALRELPELRASGLGEERLDLLFRLAERLDGLPRHIAVHPCGVLLSDATLLDRTPVEASYAGFPMSQFDKDDVEELGLLKLDVLGIRMQSAMAHALTELARVDGVEIDLDDEAQVPFDDEPTYSMISDARTLGVFQIESPGQRELVGKSGIESFGEIITDISLFRPGPVKSDMVTPYLEAKQGWRSPRWMHPDLKPILEDTHGVVVFHEQVIEMIAQMTGVSYAEADERRRALGDPEGMAETERWFFPRALARGYELPLVREVWKVLASFASFGFCKAHAAAFALPTYQSAWLKAHYPAHFLAGVLTHDPGMYPKRLILDDARQFGVAVLPLDVNASEKEYTVEWVGDGGGASVRTTPSAPSSLQGGQSHPPPSAPPPSPAAGPTAYGIRLALSELKGISEAEVDRIVAARPYSSLSDFWHRARVSRPVAERLVLAGAFDGVYGLGEPDRADGVRRRDRVTRRDLLLQVAELDRFGRAVDRAARGRGLAGKRSRSSSAERSSVVEPVGRGIEPVEMTTAQVRVREAAARSSSDPLTREGAPRPERHALAEQGVWARASAQSRATRAPEPVSSVQLALDLGDAPLEAERSGLPEMDAEERLRAELEILGLDASRHVVEGYAEFLDELGTTRSRDLLAQRSKAGLLVAGVKVATQTPPIRSGRRVIFLTLDDATGPVDCTFFEDAQGSYAATVFHSWLLVVRGELRRTGRRGVSVRATGCWALPELYALWRQSGIEAVREAMAVVPEGFGGVGAAAEEAVAGAAESRSTRPVMSRVLVHSSGFRMSPYADVKPAGEDVAHVSRNLWHRSPGSAG